MRYLLELDYLQALMFHDRKTVGEMLTSLRKEEGITQAELAEQLGVSQARISQIENEGPATVKQLCEYMNALEISWRLMKWTDPVSPEEHKRTKKSPSSAQGLLYGPRLG